MLLDIAVVAALSITVVVRISALQRRTALIVAK
jgi:hypothetical protein